MTDTEWLSQPGCFCDRNLGQPDEECADAGRCLLARVRGWRGVLTEARHAIAVARYWIRPYDMIADRRRWKWQPRTRCQWSGGRPWELP